MDDLRATFEKAAELERRTLETNFAVFARQSWAHIDPHPYIDARYLSCVGEYLQALRLGDVRRLLVAFPPRYGKSSLFTIQFPCWVWATLPQTQWLFSSYGTELSVDDFSVRRRRLIESAWYQRRWPVALTDDSNQKHLYTNTSKGFMYSTSTGAAVTGKGADWLVVDDPLKAKDAYSDAERNKANQFFRETLMTRLNSQSDARIVVVHQRLHDNDLIGELIEDKKWEYLELQAEAETDTKIFLPISGKTWKRPKGDLLEPKRFPKTVLDAMRVDMGTRGYQAQMQQRPTPNEGAIFDPNHWKYFDELPVLEQLVLSVDCNFKDTATSDFVSIELWGFVGPYAYFIDKQTERLGYAATKQAIRHWGVNYPLNAILVEDKANGSAIISELRTEFNVIPIEPEGGKESRAWAAQPTQEAGNIFLPNVSYERHQSKTWVPAFVELAAKFRGEGSVKNDDDIDSFTQAINWRRGNRFALYEHYRELAAEKKASAEPAAEMEKAAGVSLAKVVVSSDTPKCEGCGGVTFIHTVVEGQDVRTCPRCVKKCPRCKGREFSGDVCRRCGRRTIAA